jgi:hypothetical protein
MKTKWIQIRVSESEKCLIDSIANRDFRENRTTALVTTVIHYAEIKHSDLHGEYLVNCEKEIKAEGKELPKTRFNKRIKETKEETKSKADDGQV